MNRFAFLSLYRSLARQKLFAALSIGGLAVGIAVFIVLGLYDHFETSFETWLPHHDQIYLVETNWQIPGSLANGPDPNTMGGLLEELRQDFPGVVGTRISGGGGSVLRGSVATSENVVEVDPSFFQVFELPMVNGDGARALVDPTSVLISESVARKYFGEMGAVGQSLRISLTASPAPRTYRVAGVFKDLPKNTDLQFNILAQLPKTPDPADKYWYHWGSASVTTYLRFGKLSEAKAFEQKLPAFVDRRGLKDFGKNASKSEGLLLLPITRFHLTPFGSSNGSQEMTVITLGIVGALALLIALVNYVNLATARAGLRAREVAMRKVLGAARSALIRQFLGEAMLTVAVAALAGLILAELGLPLINAAGGLSLTIPYALILPSLLLLVLVIGLAAGAYPALLLSKYPAASVLASARAPGGGRAGARVRELLVILQFGLATAFIIGTAVLVAQTRHVRHTDLGFKREGLLIVSSLNDAAINPAQARSLVSAMSALPHVQSVGVSDQVAGGSGISDAENVPLPGVPGSGPSLHWISVGRKFFDTYGVKPIAGRLFDDAHAADNAATIKKGTPFNIVITRNAVPVLGSAPPRTLSGKLSVEKIHERSSAWSTTCASSRLASRPIRRFTCTSPDLPSSRIASIRFAGDPRSMLAAVRALWERMEPQVPFAGDTADTRLEKFYEADDRLTRLFGIGAGLAVLIGCVGLWGLASFNTARRTKEIGIRKTLGASAGDIVRLLVSEFLRPVVLANVLAWPLAFVAMRTWLQGFDDRISLSPLYFLGASLLAIVIALVTVIGQSLRASRATPAWAIRHE